MTDADFLTEFGVGWTAVGMEGAEEVGTVARIFIFIVTVGRCPATIEHAVLYGVLKEGSICLQKNRKRRVLMQNSSGQTRRAALHGSCPAWQSFVRPGS